MRLWIEAMEYRESCYNLLWSETDGQIAEREIVFLLSASPAINHGAAIDRRLNSVGICSLFSRISFALYAVSKKQRQLHCSCSIESDGNGRTAV
jgi:hypothetical protein